MHASEGSASSAGASGGFSFLFSSARRFPAHIAAYSPPFATWRCVPFVCPHEERHIRLLQLGGQEPHLLPALVLEVPGISDRIQLSFRAVDHHCETVGVRVRIVEVVSRIEAFPQLYDDLLAVIAYQRYRTVNRSLRWPRIKVRPPLTSSFFSQSEHLLMELLPVRMCAHMATRGLLRSRNESASQNRISPGTHFFFVGPPPSAKNNYSTGEVRL